MEEKTFEIWSEGYLCTGMEGSPARASYVGEAQGIDFIDACKNYYKNNPYFTMRDNIPRYWGCRLFPTEKEARKRFG